jgi:hypothetical protein
MSMPIKLDKWIRLNESVQRQVKNDEIQQIISQNLQLCRQRKSEDLKNLLKLLSDNLKVLIKVKLKNEEDIKKGKCINTLKIHKFKCCSLFSSSSLTRASFDLFGLISTFSLPNSCKDIHAIY